MTSDFRKPQHVCVCSQHITPSILPVETVPVPSHHASEIPVVWSQTYDTEMRRCIAVSVANIACHIRQARYILPAIELYEILWKNIKKRTGKMKRKTIKQTNKND